jgi:molybdopterin/thiamine biosynthesis adenylyltransferase/Zn-dependent protease
MGYLYRNPQLQMDLPQHEPDSRLVLNHETRRYLRLGLREFDWLNRIEGQVQEDEIAALCGIELGLAQELVKRLFAAKLVCVSAEPVRMKTLSVNAATELENRRFEWVQFGQLRFHIGRPKVILEFLKPVTCFLMKRSTILGVVLFSLLSFCLLVIQIPHLIRAGRGFAWNTPHVLEIVCLLFVVTIVHEFGHAAACDNLGAPVRSMGVMLYYLQPAAYADVTDSWQLPSRWDRVKIASSGLYVQTILTCLTLVLWTLLHRAGQPAALLAIFFFMNVSIIIFNLTPFVRLDGYWILSNVLGIPNLRNRAVEGAFSNVRAFVTRKPVQPKDLRYKAVLSMTPIGQALLSIFGFTSIWFEAAMWIAGVGSLFRVTRFLHMRERASYWSIAGLCVGFVLLFLIKQWNERKRSQSQSQPQPTAASSVSIVIHAFESDKPVRLNPHLTAIKDPNGAFIFAWSSGNPITISTHDSLFAILPALRSGDQTIDAIRKHPNFRPEFDDVLQQLWHHKYLRYSAEWECSGEDIRYSRLLGWMSMNRIANGGERDVLERLKRARVTILGVGGLGTHVAWNLAACGVGELHLVDGDCVELSNLNRQLFFVPEDVGRRKVDVAAEALLRFNPQLKIQKTFGYVQSVGDIVNAVRGSNHVVRAVDTPADVALLVNEACVRLKIPYTGAGFFAQGTVMGPTVIPGVSSCFACNSSGDLSFDRGNFGTIAPLVTATAGLLSNEVVICLGGIGTAKSINNLVWTDAPELNVRFQEVKRNENCPICGTIAMKRIA